MIDIRISLSIYQSMRIVLCMKVINVHHTSVHHNDCNKTDRYQLLATHEMFSRCSLRMYMHMCVYMIVLQGCEYSIYMHSSMPDTTDDCQSSPAVSLVLSIRVSSLGEKKKNRTL